MDADTTDLGGLTIIRITRGTKGDVMASVERMQWFEPDGHEYTGYADVVTDRRRPVVEVLAEYRKTTAVRSRARTSGTWPGESRAASTARINKVVDSLAKANYAIEMIVQAQDLSRQTDRLQ